jgi:hypothetical protein
MYSSEYKIDNTTFSLSIKIDNFEDANRFYETIKKASTNLGFIKTREIFRKGLEVWYRYNVFVKGSKYSFSLFVKEGYNLKAFEKQFKASVEKPSLVLNLVPLGFFANTEV